MKQIKKGEDSDNDFDEFSLMWNISHENILKYYDHFDHEIDDLDYICVITEYCEVIILI